MNLAELGLIVKLATDHFVEDDSNNFFGFCSQLSDLIDPNEAEFDPGFYPIVEWKNREGED